MFRPFGSFRCSRTQQKFLSFPNISTNDSTACPFGVLKLFYLSDLLNFSNLLDLFDLKPLRPLGPPWPPGPLRLLASYLLQAVILFLCRSWHSFQQCFKIFKFAVQTRVLVFNATYKWCGRQLSQGPGLTSFTQVSPRLFIPHLNYGSIYFKWTDFWKPLLDIGNHGACWLRVTSSVLV